MPDERPMPRLSDERLQQIDDGWHSHQRTAVWPDDIMPSEVALMAREINERRALERPFYFDGIPAEQYDVVCPLPSVGGKLSTAHYVVVAMHQTRIRFAHEDGDVWWEASKYRLHMRGPKRLTKADCQRIAVAYHKGRDLPPPTLAGGDAMADALLPYIEINT